MTYKLVIFDFDGTLADTFPMFLARMNAMADEFGFQRVPEDQIEDYRALSAREVTKRLGVPAWKMPLMARRWQALALAEAPNLRLFPGVVELLERLAAAGVTSAVVTSNSEAVTRAVLREAAALVPIYECGAAMFGKRSKFRRVLRRSGARAADAVCVGDELRDLEAATPEGIPFIAVGWGYTRMDALRRAGPAHACESFAELEALLLPA